MTELPTFPNLVSDSLARTRALIVPSLPYAVLFAVACGVLVWAAGVLPEDGAGFFPFAGLALLTLFAHSLFSVSMYMAALDLDAQLLVRAWKLSLAWILVLVIAAIGASMIILFFALIGASLGVVSGESGQEITDMAAQMREGGTFWPLFIVFLLTLFGVFWFAVRMMTFAAATSARGRVHVFRTWAWTKGAFSRLGPAMFGLVAVPIGVLTLIATWGVSAIIPVAQTTVETGVCAALFMFILSPSAWLGHGFAAAVFAALAPVEAAD